MRKPKKRPTTQRERSQMKTSVQTNWQCSWSSLGDDQLAGPAQNLVQNLSIS
jgi:hypothetical protein